MKKVIIALGLAIAASGSFADTVRATYPVTGKIVGMGSISFYQTGEDNNAAVHEKIECENFETKSVRLNGGCFSKNGMHMCLSEGANASMLVVTNKSTGKEATNSESKAFDKQCLNNNSLWTNFPADSTSVSEKADENGIVWLKAFRN